VTPAQRKAASEALLEQHAVPINRNLPMIESEEETRLRTSDEVLRRLVSLWAVAGTAFLPGNGFFRSYVEENGLEKWLSPRETEYLFSDAPSEQQRIHFSWQLESLYFLAWCAGLMPRLALPTTESSLESFLHLFPQQGEGLERLRNALTVRSIEEVLNWSDLLYRMHWAVREARLRGTTQPLGVTAGAVQEWHRAANWMTRYEGEDDWDAVPTDT
jgi:Domain of unknown function (DUF4272)